MIEDANLIFVLPRLDKRSGMEIFMPRPIKCGSNFEAKRYTIYNGKRNNEHMAVMQAVTGHYEIGFTISGDRRIFSTDGEWEMHSGYVGTSPLNLAHQSFSISDLPYDGILIKYSFEIADKIKTAVGPSEFNRFYNKKFHVLKPRDQKIILNYFEQVLKELESPGKYSDIKLTSILTLIILHIMENEIISPLDNFSSASVSKSNSFKYIDSAMRYIEKNYGSNITLDSTARLYNFSPAHFSRLFKSCTGDTFSKYLMNVRFEKAIMLLASTDKSITEISQECGFTSTSYFCDAFKRKYLKTPLQYKKGL